MLDRRPGMYLPSLGACGVVKQAVGLHVHACQAHPRLLLRQGRLHCLELALRRLVRRVSTGGQLRGRSRAREGVRVAPLLCGAPPLAAERRIGSVRARCGEQVKAVARC